HLIRSSQLQNRKNNQLCTGYVQITAHRAAPRNIGKISCVADMNITAVLNLLIVQEKVVL
ncbi:hypothetical protein ACH5RR_028359, partial [Cinchona calisaya]